MAGELASQEFAGDTPFDHVVLPTGSGGTHVGLVVGARLLGRAWSVTGVCVLGDPAYFTALHRRILRELAFRARLPHKIRPEEIAVFSRDGGEMYDAYTVDDVRETIRVARDHGVIFEPVYMLKALNGLRALIQRGSIARGARVVLVHTGGLFSLLGTDDRISSAVAEFFTSEPLNLPGAGALQAPVG
jgi:1-aminocyclopropane-1-carboxylate deaminase/D-cysteine desulfhydrase-like pyridoxal-dependent ACC family enzyme